MEDEFSRTIKAGHIHETAQRHVVTADERAREILAKRFGLPAIAALKGGFTLSHERGGVIAARLEMTATVTQVCVITLEPFQAEIADTVDLRFVPASHHAAKEGEEEEDLTPEALDGPDEIPYDNDLLDLGEALAEQLALSLDPYPRAPGAVLPDEAQDQASHPFAALRARLPKPD
jgi:uncharacterized metal-binding protein YceD (DUF177 family)